MNTYLTSKSLLVEYLEQGCKPREAWRIGTEHEKFAFRTDDLTPLQYGGECGIEQLLTQLQRFNWKPVFEDGHIIALQMDDGSSITLEPAGQIELSGAPLQTIHETCKEVGAHLQQVKAIAHQMGIGFLGLGYHPKALREELPWMPKNRYKIMQAYMPKKGTLGIEMMKSTCTVQVNLDFDSEQTMVKMFRVSLALQPIATALFANSPFKGGKPNGYLSYRSHIWTDTDADRCGTLPFVFEDGFGFERYVDYMLDVPMYFVYRKGVYLDASGLSFKDFMNGELSILPGEYPTIKDWEDHLTTAFPEVRLKKFLEMRGADGGPWNRLCALPALWVGLLYDQDSLNEAWDLVKDWTPKDHAQLRTDVPVQALKTPFRETTVGNMALDVLDLAHAGLTRRNRLNDVGQGESHFLKPLFHIAQSGKTPAESLLDSYEHEWQKTIDPIFKNNAY